MTERTWAGTHEFTAPELLDAVSIDQVQQLVSAGGRVRALGTRHSFNDIADTTGTLVTVTGIPADPVLDETARTVTVGAGVRYGVLATWLEERGWALHNLGSLPHISVGGATATGTHGSGTANGVLSTAVSGIQYVDARGELVTTRRGDPDFDGMVVHLGAYGVAVRITLDVQPSFSVRQDAYDGLTWDALLDDLEGVTSAAYSVSVFTRWVGEVAGQVWLKTRLDSDDITLPDDWRGATRSLLEQPILIEGSENNLTTQGGVPGPWLERLPHFRLDTTPSNGDEIQTEFFVDRAHGADALRAVRTLGDRIEPHLLVTELRTAAADELWLSGAYRRDILCIHFTWKNEPDAVAALLPDIQSALADFDARPHWGKVNSVSPDEIARVTPRLADARALFERLDPEVVFANDYLTRVGLR